MKKLLLLSMIALFLGACTTTKTDDGDRVSRNVDVNWYEEAGDPGSEYWWVDSYDSTESDSD